VRPRERTLSVRTLDCVRADASVLPLRNFITDATVRPSDGQLSGHRPIFRPSVIVRVTTLIPANRESWSRSRPRKRRRVFADNELDRDLGAAFAQMEMIGAGQAITRADGADGMFTGPDGVITGTDKMMVRPDGVEIRGVYNISAESKINFWWM
jgi:hypothetical protein